jgi:hypothetical protein
MAYSLDKFKTCPEHLLSRISISIPMNGIGNPSCTYKLSLSICYNSLDGDFNGVNGIRERSLGDLERFHQY